MTSIVIGSAYLTEETVVTNQYSYAAWYQKVQLPRGHTTELRVSTEMLGDNPYWVFYGGGEGVVVGSDFTSGFGGVPHGSKHDQDVGETALAQSVQTYGYGFFGDWPIGSVHHQIGPWYFTLDPEWEVVEGKDGKPRLQKADCIVRYWRVFPHYHPSTDALIGHSQEPITKEEYLAERGDNDDIYVTFTVEYPQRSVPTIDPTFDEIPF